MSRTEHSGTSDFSGTERAACCVRGIRGWAGSTRVMRGATTRRLALLALLATVAMLLPVQPAWAQPEFGNNSPQVYIVNSPIPSQTLPDAIFGMEPLTYSITPMLPTGLTFNAATRVLSGTPTTVKEETKYTYMVADRDGIMSRFPITFLITIEADSIPMFDGAHINDQTYPIGAPITPLTLPPATDGDGMLTYRLTPALPSVLRFDTGTRVLSGAPVPGTEQTAVRYTYTVTDSDSVNPDSDSLDFAITIDPPQPADSATIGENEPQVSGNANRPGGGEYWRDRANGDRCAYGTLDITGTDGAWTYDLNNADLAVDLLNDGEGLEDRCLAEAATSAAGPFTIHAFTLSIAGVTDLVFTAADNIFGDRDGSVTDGSVTEATGSLRLRRAATTPVIAATFSPGATAATYGTTVVRPDGDWTYTLDATNPAVQRLADDAIPLMDTFTLNAEIEGKTLEAAIEITINGADDVPRFSAGGPIIISGSLATPLALTLPQATGGDGDLGRYTYTIEPALPTGLSFDAPTRVLAGTATMRQDRTVYTLIAVDDDSNTAAGDAARVNFSITIATAGTTPIFFPLIPEIPLVYVVGAPIPPRTLQSASAILGDGDLTYSIMPTLPTGLSFDTDPNIRMLSGTPVRAQDRIDYTYAATDSDGDRAVQILGITVEANSVPTLPPVTLAPQRYTAELPITPLSLPRAQGGNSIGSFITLNYRIEPALPNGLSFNIASLRITGTPTTAQDITDYTYIVADRDTNTDPTDEARLAFTIEVLAAATPSVEISATSPTSLTEANLNGARLTVTLTNANYREMAALAPNQFTLNTTGINGLTVDSLRRNSATAVTLMLAHDGTDLTTEGTIGVTVLAAARTSGTDNLTTGTVQVADNAAPVITPPNAQSYTQDTRITPLPIRVTDAESDPLTITVANLPAGLSFDPPTRQVFGTPTAPSVDTMVTLTVTDGVNDAVTADFTITVHPPPSFGEAIIEIQHYIFNQAITPLTLPAAIGGNPPLSYRLADADGNRPAGLSFDSNTRVLSGTPTTAQSLTDYTYTVTDTDSNEARLQFMITVTAGLLDLNGDGEIQAPDAQILYYIERSDLSQEDLTTLLGELRGALSTAQLIERAIAWQSDPRSDVNGEGGEPDEEDARILYYTARFETLLRASPALLRSLLGDDPAALESLNNAADLLSDR